MSKRSLLVLGSAMLVMGAGMTAGAATIAQYNFDALTNSDQTVADISGNNHDITFNKAMTLTTDTNPFSNQTGNDSINIGTSTFSTIANLNTINLNNGGQSKLTIEGWIYPTSYGNNSTALVYLESTESGTGRYQLSMTQNGNAYARIYNGSGSAVTSSDALVLNEWNYLAMVYNAGPLTLYIKNSNHPTLTSVGTANPSVSLPTALSKGWVANNDWNAGTARYDDIRISTSALSDAELGYHASFTPPVPEPASLMLVGLGGLMLVRRRKA